jgi:hypothetical protein
MRSEILHTPRPALLQASNDSQHWNVNEGSTNIYLPGTYILQLWVSSLIRSNF